jgi:hypothetical protein
MGLAAGLIFLAGCLAPAEDPEPAAEEQTAGGRGQGLQVLQDMGFKPDQIRPVEDGFMVEGDMFYRLEDLTAPQPLAKTAQRARQAISNPPPNTVKLAIHSSMADWGMWVHQAVNNWNSLNTRLHIEVVTSGQNTTIYSDADVACPLSLRNQAYNTLGAAWMSYNGVPGEAICMNKDGFSMQYIGVRVAAMTHEIGHTLSFEHTDNTSATLIPGTPTSDAKSIMNAITPTTATGIFTMADRLAAEILYPSVKPLGGSDLDWDRKDDMAVFRPRDGMWIYLSSVTGFQSGFTTQWGQRGDMPMEDMDMDGDGKDDFVCWRPSDGYWRAKLSNSPNRSIQWGQLGDVPLSNHDMDGDGKDDVVVWRWTEGKFHVLTSRSNFTQGAWYGWGQAGDIPVSGIDADRDGKDDWVVWRPNQGIFYVWNSANNFASSMWYGWGQAGDIPLGSTDMDRDYRDDLMIWRPGDANWWARTSSTNFNSSWVIPLGARGDTPLIGTDVDQDGLRDMIVWRPWNGLNYEGNFFVRTSSSGFNTTKQYSWPPR